MFYYYDIEYYRKVIITGSCLGNVGKFMVGNFGGLLEYLREDVLLNMGKMCYNLENRPL